MQIHEITLQEAEWKPLDPKEILAKRSPASNIDFGPKIPTRVGTELPNDPAAFKAQQDALSAKQAQYQQQSANALDRMKASPATTTPDYSGGQKTITPTVKSVQVPMTTQTQATPDAGAKVFGQMAQSLAPTTPTAPLTPATPAASATSSTGGTITPTSTGVTHTANVNNPNVIAQHPETQKAQQQWDLVNQQLRKQYPGRSEQQYQQTMLKKMGYSRPGVLPNTLTAKAPAIPARPAATAAPAAPPAKPAPAATAATPITATTTQYPPITLGSGPQAQVYVNKGRGYIDSKTNKPMPPSIVKALGLK